MTQHIRHTDTADRRARRDLPENRALASWKRRVTSDALILAALIATIIAFVAPTLMGDLPLALIPGAALGAAGMLVALLGTREASRGAIKPSGYVG